MNLFMWTTPDALVLWNIDGERPEWENARGGRFRLICVPLLAVHKRRFRVEMWRGHGGSGWEFDFTPEATISLALLRDDSRERLEKAGIDIIRAHSGSYLLWRGGSFWTGTEWANAGQHQRNPMNFATYDEALLAGRRAMK